MWRRYKGERQETFQFNIDFGDRFFLFTSEPTSDAGSVPAFSFLLASSLTNAGGTIAVESGSEGAGPVSYTHLTLPTKA